MQQGSLDIKNAGKDTMILRPKEMIGIVEIRSLGYYKIDTSFFLLILKVLELVKFYCVIEFWISKVSG